jgi:hypothetical protein
MTPVQRAVSAALRATLLFGLVLLLTVSEARAAPVPPCPDAGPAVSPAYGETDGPPAVETWRDIEFEGGDDCLGRMRGRLSLVVALAGRFTHGGTVADLAARVGAVSETEGLMYWSTTEGRWRRLISEAFALEDATAGSPRPDFTAEEILGGRTHYFAQKDTRSTGLNIYSLTARAGGPDRLVVEIVNLSAVRFTLVKLFEAEALVSRHFIDRLGDDLWGYYGLSAVREGATGGHEKSFVNRAAAFYRFLAGHPSDREPPLAP